MAKRWLASAFAMNDAVWMRHANPWSVWTRMTLLPLIILAVWSRVWLGWWALLPVAVVAVWTWLNPQVFPVPRSTDNWASKAVLGERVWLNDRTIRMPNHHRPPIRIALGFSFAGTICMMWGLVALERWPTLLGMALAYCGKAWFADRMVWLYEEMKDATPEYRAWLY